MSDAEQRPPAGKGHPMTWTPPPESERPHGYRCLVHVEMHKGHFVWAECEWKCAEDYYEPYWYCVLLDFEVEEPARFAPLPDGAEDPTRSP